MDKSESGKKAFIYFAACTANLAAFTCGTSLGWTSPVIPKLNGHIDPKSNPLSSPITHEQASWLGCLLPLGAALSPLMAGILVDKIGRKKTLLILNTFFIVAFATAIFAENIILFFFVRVLSGLGLGGIFTVLPIFIAEIAEDEIRDTLGTFMQLFISFGILFSYAIGPYVSVPTFNIICLIAPVVFQLLFFIYVPESPYYLMSKAKTSDCQKVLMKLRTKTSVRVQEELLSIQKAVNKSMKDKGGIKDLFVSRSCIRALAISISLVAIQQLSGVEVIVFYTQPIFTATGSSISPQFSTVIIGAVQVSFNLIAPIAMNKIGKRLLLFISILGMGISEVALGYYFYLHENKENVKSIFWLPILCLVLYNAFFSVGLGPLTWAMVGELFPSHVKSVASTLTMSSCWILAFIMTKFFNNLTDVIGEGVSFWIFALVCGLGALFVYFFIPEMTGISLQEIQTLLNQENVRYSNFA